MDCASGLKKTSAASHLLFFGAPGGTGKTFVTTAIQLLLKSLSKQILAAASSAVAAQLLDDDQAANSALKVPIPVHSDSTGNIDAKFQPADDLKTTALVIGDETVMTHRNNLEVVYRKL